MPIAWAKNGIEESFGPIFRQQDLTHVPAATDQEQSAVAANSIFDAVEDLAFSAPLREVVPRLEMLGVTMKHVESEYNSNCGRPEFGNFSWDDEPHLPVIDFDQFLSITKNFSLREISAGLLRVSWTAG